MFALIAFAAIAAALGAGDSRAQTPRRTWPVRWDFRQPLLPIAKKRDSERSPGALPQERPRPILPWDLWERPYVLSQPNSVLSRSSSSGWNGLPPSRSRFDP